MKTSPGTDPFSSCTKLAMALAALVALNAHAATRYVDVNNATPAPPYTDWSTAATNIQDAIDAASPGELVLVTNGVYQTGGRAMSGLMTNRIALTTPVTVQSVNGPDVTVIQGSRATQIRCAYLANGATLSGFTLTNGGTQSFGEAETYCTGGGVWCESDSAVVSNCVISGNWASFQGGGAGRGTLWNCVLENNSAGSGGGAYNCTLINCTLRGNSVSSIGGGAYGGMLKGCALLDNSSSYIGGGAYGGTHYNCTLTGNSATEGGGAYAVALYNCLLYYNRAEIGPNYSMGGLRYCCTTPLPAAGTGNIEFEPQLAGLWQLAPGSPCRGAGSAAYSSGTDLDGETWATPPAIGCDEVHPEAATGPLSVGIQAPYTNLSSSLDLELRALVSGTATATRWDFGDGTVLNNRAYAAHRWTAPGDYPVELRAYNASNPDGVSALVVVHIVTPPTHYVSLDSPDPVPPYTSWATAATNIQDAVDAVTTPGALVLVSNGVYSAGTQTAGGATNTVAVLLPMTVQSVNGPEMTTIRGSGGPGADSAASVRCVYLAEDAALAGFTLTNGSAPRGGGVCCASLSSRVSNCLVISNSAHFGGGVYSGTVSNCTLVGNGNRSSSGGGAYTARLDSCTLLANAASSGGGAYGGSLNHCTIISNSASGGLGGGAYTSMLTNCVLLRNWAYNEAGGAYGGVLFHCSVLSNSTFYPNYGGLSRSAAYNCAIIGNSSGAYGSALYNCSVVANTNYGVIQGTAQLNCLIYYNPQNWGSSSGFTNCCTTPLPAGKGNFTNAPALVDWQHGNLRLQANSPCINAGLNAFAPGPTDLDGNPRIGSGTVDLGAYEYQGPGSTISYAWLQQYRLPTDGSADLADPDGDGHNTWQEWRCQTDPTNQFSALRLLSAAPVGPSVRVRWQSVAGVKYFLERSTNISSAFSLLATDIVGPADIASYDDLSPPNPGPSFYRVGVNHP